MTHHDTETTLTPQEEVMSNFEALSEKAQRVLDLWETVPLTPELERALNQTGESLERLFETLERFGVPTEERVHGE